MTGVRLSVSTVASVVQLSSTVDSLSRQVQLYVHVDAVKYQHHFG